MLHQTIARRVDHIDMHPKNFITWLKKNNYFPLCLDKSTDLADISKLVIFISTIQGDFSVAEEMLDFILFYSTTKSTDIFETIHKVCQTTRDKCSCTVTNGARAMIRTEIGFAGLLKQNTALFTKRPSAENVYVKVMSS